VLGPPRTSGSGATLALAVGLAALVLAGAQVAVEYRPHTWIERDGRFYTNVNTTLVEAASVVQDEFAASWYRGDLGWNRNLDASWSNIALGRDGVHLPKHPVLLPLASTPLFWAFGLHGTLIFNVLMFALAGAAAFAVARRHGSAAAAAFAALALLLGTSIREYAYDYHVDVFILALFTGAMAALYARRGGLAGLLLGATVVLRPTMLLWMPSLALIVAERRDWRTLRRALVGGAVPLVLFALSNWWLYGAPWWTSYNRVLVVVNGEPRIADHNDAFGVPLRAGLQNLWAGPYGVRHRLPLLAAAGPGLLLLVRRRPLYVLAAAVGTLASVLLFAKYRWYGDRFLWPSAALLVPAVAVTADGLGRLVSRHPGARTALVAGMASAALAGARLAGGGPLEARFGPVDASELLLRLFAVGAVGFGLTRAADRLVRGPLAVVAPLALWLLPGVAERALGGGDDLWLAAAVALALGARHWLPALFFAALAAWLIGTANGTGAAVVGLADLRGLFDLDPGDRRAVAVLTVAAAVSLPLLGRGAWLLAPLGLLALDRVAALGGDRLPLFALALLCLPLPVLTARPARWLRARWSEGSRRRHLAVVAALLGALLLLGAARRLDDAPFRIASYRGVREAEVHLGEVPCDFLAWEHLNWECATFDRGVHGETGLATSRPLHVGGEARAMFLITTQRAMPRRVRWDRIAATDTLVLRWAVPDEARGGGTLRAWIDGEPLAALPLADRPDGRVHVETLDTAAWAGEPVELELELSGRRAMVLVDGGFVP
jgi:hypothetical protein